MSESLEFGLLGPLLVRRGGAEVPLRRGHLRSLLALLLLEANQVVSVDTLTEALWGAAPPASAAVSVRGYIRGLRLALGDAGRSRIVAQPRGYLIRVAADELDAPRFERLLVSARAAARQESWDDAARHARAALSVWRGEPLADIESETVQLRDAPRLAELRLQATEIRIDAELRMGGHAEAVPELRRLCGAHPLREHPHAQLMRALYRCGQQGEALAVYQGVRGQLVRELGVQPGGELNQLHERILAADPALTALDSGPGAAVSPTSPVPRELPGAIRHFTGRRTELATLTGLLDQFAAQAQDGVQSPGAVLVSVIAGAAGTGKTALAVYWAHQVAERFPDGQLYLDLRGYAAGPPVSAADALARFLRALGVPEPDMPGETDERAARYRSLVAGRRMLIVLDNAGSVGQVRPLLPGTSTCAVTMTSRDGLAELVAENGADRLDLAPRPAPDAPGDYQPTPS